MQQFPKMDSLQMKMFWHFISSVWDASIKFLSYQPYNLIQLNQVVFVCGTNYVQSGPEFQKNILVIYANILPRKISKIKGRWQSFLSPVCLLGHYKNICKSQYQLVALNRTIFQNSTHIAFVSHKTWQSGNSSNTLCMRIAHGGQIGAYRDLWGGEQVVHNAHDTGKRHTTVIAERQHII